MTKRKDQHPAAKNEAGKRPERHKAGEADPATLARLILDPSVKASLTVHHYARVFAGEIEAKALIQELL